MTYLFSILFSLFFTGFITASQAPEVPSLSRKNDYWPSECDKALCKTFATLMPDKERAELIDKHFKKCRHQGSRLRQLEGALRVAVRKDDLPTTLIIGEAIHTYNSTYSFEIKATVLAAATGALGFFAGIMMAKRSSRPK